MSTAFSGCLSSTKYLNVSKRYQKTFRTSGNKYWLEIKSKIVYFKGIALKLQENHKKQASDNYVYILSDKFDYLPLTGQEVRRHGPEEIICPSLIELW